MSKQKDRLELKLKFLEQLEESANVSMVTKIYARLIIDRIKKILKKE